MEYKGGIGARVFIGSILKKMHNHREDRGLDKMMKGKFSSYEEMGTWNRYGMCHDSFSEFKEECTSEAESRYSEYIILMKMIFSVEVQYKQSLSDWYFYREFYCGIVKRLFKF